LLPFTELISFEDNEGQRKGFQNYLVSYTKDIDIMLLIVIFKIQENFRIVLLVLLGLFCCNQLVAFLIFNFINLVIAL